MMRLSPPVAIESLIRFPAGILVALVGAAVPGFFALGESDFDLGTAIAEVDAQRNDG